ncbi:MAG TPA: ABC transporter ATP-binding protein [Myxococcota bacterium]|nr:ABC transporter ATP-binding protein [Myxococcota bacterium]
MLSARDVYKHFATPAGTLEVLRGIDLEVAPGETVAVLGESGSGKSTLLALLAGLDVPTRGSVCIDGHDTSALSERDLAALRARSVGIVFQSFHLMGGLSAEENVRLPLELRGDADAHARARAALAQVGLAARAEHLPARLSGGECQRVAIARALVVEPGILLADEPSGSLDERTGEAVDDLLFELVARRGTALVLVTHSERLAARCQRRVRLTGGRLAA